MRGNPYMILSKRDRLINSGTCNICLVYKRIGYYVSINSYLSINIAYTSPQLHNKLSFLQKSKIQEILLENPYFYLRKTPNPAVNGPELKGDTLRMERKAGEGTAGIGSH